MSPRAARVVARERGIRKLVTAPVMQRVTDLSDPFGRKSCEL